MKITSLLEDMDARSRYLAQKHDQRTNLGDAVSPLQIGLLRKISLKQLDPLAQSLSHKTHEALEGLIALGLLDATYDLTDAGTKFVRNAKKVDSPDLQDARSKMQARKAMKRDTQIPKDNIEGLDDEDLDDEPETDDEEGMTGTVRVAKNKSKVDPLRSDDFDSFNKDDLKGMDDEGEYKWD